LDPKLPENKTEGGMRVPHRDREQKLAEEHIKAKCCVLRGFVWEDLCSHPAIETCPPLSLTQWANAPLLLRKPHASRVTSFFKKLYKKVRASST
jgi:hypothetical protein